MISAFITILNMGIRSNCIIAIVLVVRRLMRKAPAGHRLFLWAFVGLRLVFPTLLPSRFSLLPPEEILPKQLPTVRNLYIDLGSSNATAIVNQDVQSLHGVMLQDIHTVLDAMLVIWLIGVVFFWFSQYRQFKRIKLTVKDSRLLYRNIRQCERIRTAFILGLTDSVIYVPSHISNEQLECILQHEQVHIRRKDHWWKFFAYGLLSVYWFSPLCWVALHLFTFDLECSCDEAVIRSQSSAGIAQYAQTILDCSIADKKLSCISSFGHANSKERIRRVLNYKKPGTQRMVLSVALVLTTAVCVLTDPFVNATSEDQVPATGSLIYDDGTVQVFDGPADETVFRGLAPNGGKDMHAEIDDPDSNDAISSETSMEWETILSTLEQEGIYRAKAQYGDPIVSLCNGVVLSAVYERGYGNTVTILDQDGLEWKYCHCSDFWVEGGEQVHIGDTIAGAGDTGYTVGPSVCILRTSN